MDSDRVSCLSYGHSWVRRLTRHVLHEVPGGMQLNNVELFWHGVSGMCMYRMWQDSYIIANLQPDIVILDIGTNDLAHPFCDPVMLAQDILRFARSLIDNNGVRQVMILPIFNRWEEHALYPARPDFNQQARIYNIELSQLIQSGIYGPHICAWHHRWSMQYWWTWLEDGVHLTGVGMTHYRRSVRGAIVVAAGRIQPRV